MSEPIHIISLGAGVQSSTMALMAASGEITPMPVAAVFADTQAEPSVVYRWLEWLIERLLFPVIQVTKGNLRMVALTIRDKKKGFGKWAKTVVPTFIQNPDGSRGTVQRQCTHDFKLLEIQKEHARQIGKERLAEWKRKHAVAAKALRDWEKECAVARKKKMCEPMRPQWAWSECQGDPLVVAWIGITTDEVHRAKESRVPWTVNRWPLLELRMNRQACLKWMAAHNYPQPPRSACVFCPYRSDWEWRLMQRNSPEEFKSAVHFERELQHVKRETDNMRGVPFLHDSLIPLDEVNFSTEEDRGQLNMFNNECEGLCGV